MLDGHVPLLAAVLVVVALESGVFVRGFHGHFGFGMGPLYLHFGSRCPPPVFWSMWTTNDIDWPMRSRGWMFPQPGHLGSISHHSRFGFGGSGGSDTRQPYLKETALTILLYMVGVAHMLIHGAPRTPASTPLIAPVKKRKTEHCFLLLKSTMGACPDARGGRFSRVAVFSTEEKALMFITPEIRRLMARLEQVRLPVGYFASAREAYMREQYRLGFETYNLLLNQAGNAANGAVYFMIEQLLFGG